MYKWYNSRILFYVLVSIFLVFLFSGFFIVIYSNSNNSNDNTASILPSMYRTIPISTIPVRIEIPSIGVDAVIKSVGLTKLRTMESPKGPADTAWFKLGPTPGEQGSSVIAGHRGWKTGPAVFDNLYKVQVGDKVYVQNEKGGTLTFIVRKMQIYDADDIVPEVWNKNDTAHVNLITCSGSWNILTGTSNKRLVVFTDLVA